ncbi:MAG: NUDIX hydrolase [Pseudomonadota bacterium]
MSVFPRTGCSAIVAASNKILLIKRGKEPYKGHWSLPGGAQDVGETLEECAIRELAEETALHATSLKFLATRDRITRNEAGEISFHYVLTTFLITSFEGNEQAGDDALEIGWFTTTEMDDLKTTPETPAFIREMLDGSPQ